MTECVGFATRARSFPDTNPDTGHDSLAFWPGPLSLDLLQYNCVAFLFVSSLKYLGQKFYGEVKRQLFSDPSMPLGMARA